MSFKSRSGIIKKSNIKSKEQYKKQRKRKAAENRIVKLIKLFIKKIKNCLF